jgi:hypothetical protein
MGIGSKLNWSRMLGFEQVDDQRPTMRKTPKIGGKIGEKIGPKSGTKG